MRKVTVFLLLSSLFILLSACSNNEESKSAEDKSEKSKTESNEVTVGSEQADMDNSSAANSPSSTTELSTERMIIHQAFLNVKVKELEKAQSNIEQKVKKYGGYIVESNVYQEDDNMSSGKMVVRIPEKHFETFLSDAEEIANVVERNVTGQDVTEEYVDLSSRVKSNRAVEARLLEFMSNAQKTEDLLKISADLAKVQEEIEVMVGKMKYLENQTSFSTIELMMYEDRVIVPNIDNDELNTWEKTKKQFMTSANFLLATGSAIIVFIFGNLPVLLILGCIVVGVYVIVKRRGRLNRKE